MCRADVVEDAQRAVAALLVHMAGVLADQAGVPASEVTIGPVDLGPEPAPS